MKNYIPIISDTLFCTLSIFILLRFVFSTFLSSTLSFIFALTLSLLSSLIFFKLFKKKSGKDFLKKEEVKKIKEMTIRLSFMKKSSQLTFFLRIFKKFNLTAEIKNGRLYIKERGVVIFLHFDFDMVKKSEIIKYFNQLDGDDIGVIFSSSFSTEITSFIANFNGKLKLYDEKEVFSILKKAEIFPENDVCFFREKEKKWDFSLLLNKKRAKNYFFFGVIFMLYSFIVPIKLYYIIVGSIFLILSLSLKLFGKNLRDDA